MIYGITVDGKPVPKGRPRFAGGRVFTPKTTLDYEKLIAQAWFAKYGTTSVEGRITVHVDVYSTTADRSDVDNYLKSVLDGLQGAAFENDNKVTCAKVSKTKVLKGEAEFVRVAIFPEGAIVGHG